MDVIHMSSIIEKECELLLEISRMCASYVELQSPNTCENNIPPLMMRLMDAIKTRRSHFCEHRIVSQSNGIQTCSKCGIGFS